MSIKVKRVLNAFLLGFAGSAAALYIAKQAEINDAIAVGDWQQLRFLIVPLITGGLTGGVRALQSYLTTVPSPEPEENAK